MPFRQAMSAGWSSITVTATTTFSAARTAEAPPPSASIAAARSPKLVFRQNCAIIVRPRPESANRGRAYTHAPGPAIRYRAPPCAGIGQARLSSLPLVTRRERSALASPSSYSGTWLATKLRCPAVTVCYRWFCYHRGVRNYNDPTETTSEPYGCAGQRESLTIRRQAL